MSAVLHVASASVHLGEKSGKYPDGNQALVRGTDTLVAFDTPKLAQHSGAAFDTLGLVLLGHLPEDHLAGLR